MKMRFRRTLSLVCAAGLLATCLPAAALSEETVIRSDIAPDQYEEFPFLAEDEVIIGDGGEEGAGEPEAPAAEPPAEEAPPAEAPVEENHDEEAPAEEVSVKPAPSEPQETTVEAPKDAPETDENEDGETNENLSAEDGETATDGTEAESMSDAGAAETETESGNNACAAGTEAETGNDDGTAVTAESGNDTDTTEAEAITADSEIVAAAEAADADLSISGELEAGKEYIVRIVSIEETRLTFVLTSGAEADAVLATEDDENRTPFEKEDAEETEESEATENRYTLNAVRFEQGSSRLVRLSAGNEAAFSLKVIAAAYTAEQTEENEDGAETEAADGTDTGVQAEAEENAADTEESDGDDTDADDDTEDETEAEDPVPDYRAWIVADAETWAPGDMLNLTAMAEAELDESIAWQMKADSEEDWKNVWYGSTYALEITEETLTGVLRFKTSDGVLSEEFSLEIQEEEAEEEEAFVLPEDRSATFTITGDGDEIRMGDVVHFNAQLTGYEGLNYTLQWQMSADDENWEDIPEANEEQMDLVITEENSQLFWRAIVVIHLAKTGEGSEG